MKRFRYPGQRYLVILLALLVLTVAGQASSQDAGVVKLARFEGPVTPVLASYLDRAIGDAESSRVPKR